MNPKERLMARIKGEPVDLIPNTSLIMQFAARYNNVLYGKYVTDYRYLVEAGIKCAREFGIDMVCAISDPFRETAGFGAAIDILPDGVPCCKAPFLQDIKDVRALSTFDCFQRERTLDRIRAVELFKEQVGEEYAVIGWIEGPIAEACDLRGMQNFMMDLHKTGEEVDLLLQTCVDQAVLFAEAQVNAGADIIAAGDAAASLIGPGLYRKYAFPYQKQLFDRIRSMGALTKLHICGDITPYLPIIKDLKVDIVDIDYKVDFKTAVDILGDVSSVCGNIDPVSVILQGDEALIEENVKDCISAMNNRAIMSSGCEIPKFTSYDNMRAFKAAVAKYGG